MGTVRITTSRGVQIYDSEEVYTEAKLRAIVMQLESCLPPDELLQKKLQFFKSLLINCIESHNGGKNE